MTPIIVIAGIIDKGREKFILTCHTTTLSINILAMD
jgi:hypothetical protein